MSTSLGLWIVILLVVLAFMAIYNDKPKEKTGTPAPTIVRPMLVPRPMQTMSVNRSLEQNFAQLQTDYRRKLALLERAIPDPVHRRLAEQELYARYLREIESWM